MPILGLLAGIAGGLIKRQASSAVGRAFTVPSRFTSNPFGTAGVQPSKMFTSTQAFGLPSSSSGGALCKYDMAKSAMQAANAARKRKHISDFPNGIPKGYRLAKTKALRECGVVTKIRKRNIANGRALTRALSRVRGFEKIARRVIKVSPRYKR